MTRPNAVPGADASHNTSDIIWIIDRAGRVCMRSAFPAIATSLWRLTDDPRTGGHAAHDRWFLTERAAVLAAMELALQRSKEYSLAFAATCALHGELAERLKCLPAAAEEEGDAEVGAHAHSEAEDRLAA